MIIIHEIIVPLANPARLLFGEKGVTIQEGFWPDFGENVPIAEQTVTLGGGITHYYLTRDGVLLWTNAFRPYGRNLAGQDNAMLDLVAWRVGDDWHVKRLISAEPWL